MSGSGLRVNYGSKCRWQQERRLVLRRQAVLETQPDDVLCDFQEFRQQALGFPYGRQLRLESAPQSHPLGCLPLESCIHLAPRVHLILSSISLFVRLGDMLGNLQLSPINAQVWKGACDEGWVRNLSWLLRNVLYTGHDACTCLWWGSRINISLAGGITVLHTANWCCPEWCLGNRWWWL